MARNNDIDRLIEEIATLKDHVAELARESAAQAGETLRKAANGAGTMAADTTDETVDALRDTIRDHPISSVASAFALGLSVARMLRH